MMAIKINASRKTTIILLAVLFLIVGGSGSYLLWRVNQEDTVAPIDSDASDNMYCNCCPTPDKSNTEQDCYAEKCIREKIVCKNTTECVKWDYGICIRNKCNNNGKPCDSDNYCRICKEYKQVCNMECIATGPGDLKPGMIPCKCTAPLSTCKGVNKCATECSEGSQCPACKWPFVGFCENGACKCLKYDEDGSYLPGHRCDDTSPCVQCPAGYERTSVTGNCKAGEKEVTGSCLCLPCENKYTATVCCKPIATNTCGDGVKAGSEQCDPPNSKCTTTSGKESICSTTCTCPEPSQPVPTCGNGKLDEGEDCDPGEPGVACSNGLTCSSSCKCPSSPEPVLTCGDGKIDTGEECDPGEPGVACSDGQTCASDCKCPAPLLPPDIPEPGIPVPPSEIPETGLFDESENIVTLGAIILFLGLGWTWLNRTYEIVNGKLVQRNKEKFERRVVKN